MPSSVAEWPHWLAPPRGHQVLMAACSGKLNSVKDLKWSEQSVLTVVMAANGYPGSYTKGTVIRDLDKATTAKVSHPGCPSSPARPCHVTITNMLLLCWPSLSPPSTQLFTP